MESRSIPTLGREPNSCELGEPVTRPDGLVVSILEDELGYVVRVGGQVGNRVITDRCFYTADEISAIGEGDVRVGIVKAAQAAYSMDVLDKNRPGTPFDELFDQVDSV
jgi:hypothetical protein